LALQCALAAILLAFIQRWRHREIHVTSGRTMSGSPLRLVRNPLPIIVTGAVTLVWLWS
jgi:hypothetical protein